VFDLAFALEHFGRFFISCSNAAGDEQRANTGDIASPYLYMEARIEFGPFFLSDFFGDDASHWLRMEYN